MGKIQNQAIHKRRNSIGQYKHVSPVIGEVPDNWQPTRITGGGAQRHHQRKGCWSDKNRRHSSPAEQASGGSHTLLLPFRNAVSGYSKPEKLCCPLT